MSSEDLLPQTSGRQKKGGPLRPSRVCTRVSPGRRGFGPPRDYKVFLLVAVL